MLTKLMILKSMEGSSRMKLSNLSKLKIGKVTLEQDSAFEDKLTVFTDNGNYAIVVYNDEYGDDTDSIIIEVFFYNVEIGTFESLKIIPRIDQKDLERNFLKQYNYYNNMYLMFK